MSKPKFIITECNSEHYINNVKISDEAYEKAEFRIEEREDFTDTLINWISECKTADKQLMKDDLKMLMKVEDRFILSSMRTNHYLYGNSKEFNTECQNILDNN
tara:strand:- start:12692 stop:13000 length:309 start_codon:yes stop_codon:yes gene_type:complete